MVNDNHYLVNKLLEYADLLEGFGDNPYKIRAYRRAARVIQHQEDNLYALKKKHFDFTQLPKIGKGIAYVIEVIIETGTYPESKINIKNKVNELATIKGLGPKRIKLLNEHYSIYKKADLLKAIRSQRLELLGPKLLAQITEQIKKPKKRSTFLRLYHGLNIINNLLTRIRQMPGVNFVECCGDYRRKKEVIEWLVVLIQCDNFQEVVDHFSQLPYIKYFLHQEKHHLKVQLVTGIDMDIYQVEQNNLATALIMHTGSTEHINQLSQYAQHKGFVFNNRGLCKKERPLTTNNEADIYHQLELQFIPPELREGRGELAAAATHELPNLVTLDDIKGDLHAHTNETDGQEPLEVMVQAALEQGLEYVAITDHSQSLTITHGLDEKRLVQQIKQIDKLNERLNKILVLKSIEVDILEDGSLDIANEVLKELDIVVCSVHSKFRLSEKKQTERILKAMDNPYFNILGHATGRLIKSRPPYAIDIDRIFQHAKERNCFIELNAQPYRMDINDLYCKKAKEMGVKIAISTDAHTTRGFSFMQLGIYQARRGWLEKDDVINTRSWPELKKLLAK